MLNYIASPEWIANDTDVDALYENCFEKDFEMEKSCFAIKPSCTKETVINLPHISPPIHNHLQDANGLIIKPSVINAYYRPSENKICKRCFLAKIPNEQIIFIFTDILTSVLQPPYYYADAPLAVNFGGIGTVIGHEITHGFDVHGSRFDATGQPRNWWANQTMVRFQEKVKCFVKQYSDYVEPLTGGNVDGDLTIKDNIADNGGLHQSYEAYKTYSAIKHPEKDLKLPLAMSRFTTEQLYFISFANTYCANFKKEFAEQLLKTDEHAPFTARVIVTLSNSKEFSKAFKCKEGSRMNPKEKCEIW
ncbi:membrane metallo-endopeptidase-like 1 isoform X2 [Leptotrombidium deliense]|uniref:Membrane metallo-endopeptidase-like 1 isoform X2 n=1 Tax=Leptotrombidium deliense TaxID=299467 RepID=A0A443SA12_9ACAR|nr:membrane metallo-endopeptidase-like 1 isoform X2 [Leptotrombidium deliense]